MPDLYEDYELSERKLFFLRGGELSGEARNPVDDAGDVDSERLLSDSGLLLESEPDSPN